jgi:hypothetical protein
MTVSKVNIKWLFLQCECIWEIQRYLTPPPLARVVNSIKLKTTLTISLFVRYKSG